MPKETITSWGRILRVEQEVASLASRYDSLPNHPDDLRTFLPYGNGRSYGDSCLNAGGVFLKTRTLDRFISFNPETGILCCESGVLLSEILRLVVPQGWFLPVTPGTRFITVGGAIANDVHGKNHHVRGTFGGHVTRFELLRSDGYRITCSATDNTHYFAATLGGLGLTGLITWAEIQLQRIANAWIDAETIRYESLDEFFTLCEESDRDYEYTVSEVLIEDHHLSVCSPCVDGEFIDPENVQQRLLPQATEKRDATNSALRTFLLSAGWHFRMEPDVWTKRVLSVPMYHPNPIRQ